MAWAAAIGQAAGDMWNAYHQQNTNKENDRQATRQMDFQEYMSNSAYQRAVVDMKRAGLNPMLAGLNQSPASSPQGASATMVAPRMGDALKSASNSALQVAALDKELDNKQADTELKHQATLTEATKQEQNVSSAKQAEATAAQIKEDTINSKIKNERDSLEMIMERDNVSRRQAERELAKEQADQDRKFIKFDNIQRRTDAVLGTANSAASLVKPKIQINTSNPKAGSYRRYHPGE